MSPTVLQIGGYRVVIYSHDHPPAHVHVISAERLAKFNLVPVELLENKGFRSRELRKIERLIMENHGLILDAWNAMHGGTE